MVPDWSRDVKEAPIARNSTIIMPMVLEVPKISPIWDRVFIRDTRLLESVAGSSVVDVVSKSEK